MLSPCSLSDDEFPADEGALPLWRIDSPARAEGMPASQAAARAVSCLFFIGAKDERFRIQSIEGIFAVIPKSL